MKQLLLFIATSFGMILFAQVGINTPSPKATLDVVANADGLTADGVIPPRLTGDQVKAADAQYSGPQTGTLIYVTAAVGVPTSKTVNITRPGYYYFDGITWQELQTVNKNTWSFLDSKDVSAVSPIDVTAVPTTPDVNINNIDLGMSLTVTIPHTRRQSSSLRTVYLLVQ